MTREEKEQLKAEFESNAAKYSSTLKAINFVAAYVGATNECLIQKGILTVEEDEQLQQKAQEYAQQEFENELARMKQELSNILDEEFNDF